MRLALARGKQTTNGYEKRSINVTHFYIYTLHIFHQIDFHKINRFDRIVDERDADIENERDGETLFTYPFFSIPSLAKE